MMTTDTAVTPPADSPTVPPSAPTRPASAYWKMWRAVPKQLAYNLAIHPVALVGFVATVTLFTSGVGLLVIVVGVVAIVAALYVGRAFGTVELAMLEWSGMPRIERPEWQDGRARQGFWGWIRALFANGHYWLYLLHTLVVNFAVALATWTITVIWTTFALAGITGWTWTRYLPEPDSNDWSFTNWFLGLGSGGNGPTLTGGALWRTESVIEFILGLIALALLPFILRGLTQIHHLIAKGMLGSFKSDDMQRTIIALGESRGAAVAAEGHSLRRLERDIHDGPQQRLVRLQMDLAAADRQLDNDPDKARALIAEAMQQSRDALEELRALSRGFAPPILLDRGLVAALESIAIRSAIPTRVFSELPDGLALPQEIERNAYFVASESIMNAAKHSGATGIDVHVTTRRIPDTDDTWLDVVVIDNGSGGAVFTPGHGLAGLEERLRGLGGTFELTSPAGGPTVAAAHLPLTVTYNTSV